MLILDFRDCVGLDSSALLAFRKIGQRAEARGFDVLLAHLGPTMLRQIARNGLMAGPRIRALPTLDEALRDAEATLLAEAGIPEAGATASFARHLSDQLGCTIEPASWRPT